MKAGYLQNDVCRQAFGEALSVSKIAGERMQMNLRCFPTSPDFLFSVINFWDEKQINVELETRKAGFRDYLGRRI